MIVGLCAVALLVGIIGATDAEALTPLGSQISSGRRSQAYFESVMRSQDRVIARIRAQTRITRKASRQARKAVGRTRAAYRSRWRILHERRARLAEIEALHAETPPEEVPEDYGERVRSFRRWVGKAERQTRAAGRKYRVAQRVDKARRYRLKALKRQRRGAVARRENAEGGLGAHIVRMTRLAHQRAELASGARMAMGGTSFAWPTVGRLSQTYGCTGVRFNPRRGSCRHFHDGLDLVAGYGSPVRTAADGVIAYAGWNPWDEGGRAWIMVVSHPDGYVTRYGHLLPGGRARVGQFVRRGQVIGRMGNTGRSTGTHLHFELLRGNTPLSPWAYLPKGMVVPRVKRAPGRKSAKAAQRRHRAEKRQRAKRAQERRERRRDAIRGGSSEPGVETPGEPPDALADTTTALFQSSLEDATAMVCEVLEQARPSTEAASAEEAVATDEAGQEDRDRGRRRADRERGADKARKERRAERSARAGKRGKHRQGGRDRRDRRGRERASKPVDVCGSVVDADASGDGAVTVTLSQRGPGPTSAFPGPAPDRAPGRGMEPLAA
jgi:murein DD-endopeptidase MepM/ murein hydrolase activator NlpD